MNSIVTRPACYDFCFPEKDTLLRVEVLNGAVTVRATRDTFNVQRKDSFVRELAAEGFIPDAYRWFSSVGSEAYLGVNWAVDYSWLVLPRHAIAMARRFMLRLLWGSSLLWLILMVSLFLI